MTRRSGGCTWRRTAPCPRGHRCIQLIPATRGISVSLKGIWSHPFRPKHYDTSSPLSTAYIPSTGAKSKTRIHVQKGAGAQKMKKMSV